MFHLSLQDAEFSNEWLNFRSIYSSVLKCPSKFHKVKNLENINNQLLELLKKEKGYKKDIRIPYIKYTVIKILVTLGVYLIGRI